MGRETAFTPPVPGPPPPLPKPLPPWKWWLGSSSELLESSLEHSISFSATAAAASRTAITTRPQKAPSMPRGAGSACTPEAARDLPPAAASVAAKPAASACFPMSRSEAAGRILSSLAVKKCLSMRLKSSWAFSIFSFFSRPSQKSATLMFAAYQIPFQMYHFNSPPRERGKLVSRSRDCGDRSSSRSASCGGGGSRPWLQSWSQSCSNSRWKVSPDLRCLEPFKRRRISPLPCSSCALSKCSLACSAACFISRAWPERS
mmetsp:Transcript_83144/g.201550  ORF Transcript_83144/g.201550 Transcript_83144/m.201550 type:complete len:260 (-) Transcript_83144:579-1358(-)